MKKCEIVAVLLTMCVTGCGCAAVACVNGLNVTLPSVPSVAFRIDVRGLTDTAIRTFECKTAGNCGQGATFSSFSDSVAIITVSAAGRSVTTQVTLAYTEGQPNGLACGPSCRQANATAALP